MKKFFSLVLALVMALSLTTVAWGAPSEAADLAALKDVVATGGEVKLTANININVNDDTQDRLVIAKDLVVDLNGHKLFSADAADDIFYVQDGASLTVKNGTLNSARVGIFSMGNNGTNANVIELDNVKINSNYFGVYHNGTAYGADVTIENSIITDDYGKGVYLSGSKAWDQLSKLTITNSTVQGDTAVEVKYADVTVNNSTLIATNPTASLSANNNGAASTGYALVLTHSGANGNGEAAKGSITVNSGTITGAVGIQATGGDDVGTAVAEIANTTDAIIAVKAGTFTDDVIPYLATGSVYKDGVVTKQGTVPSTGTTSTGTVTSGTVTPSKPTLYKLAAVGGSMVKVNDTFTSIKLTTVSGKIDADVVKYVPNIYNLDGDLYIQVAKADADYALYNNGAWIYLFDARQTTDADVITAFATSVVMDKLVVPADDDIDCGDCLKNGALASYYVSGESVYYAGGLTWAYFNGEFVKYDKDTKVAFKGHVWDADSIIYKATDVKGSKVPVTIECENCEKTFKVVYKTAFDNTWVKGVNYETAPNVLPADYYIVLESATSAPVVTPSTDKVTSAETFDAGIAMYVGMSVMAAAGSAVVIGKKKD